MNWDEVVKKVMPYIVKIETPEGHGTGFLCLYNDDRTLCGVATAYHVVSRAEEWQQPIRIHHFPSGSTAFLKESDRFISPSAASDSAVVLLPADKLALLMASVFMESAADP